LLTDAQIERYSRQIILPEVGGRGQERLLAAQLMVLAEIDDLTPALSYLVGAGVGSIRLDSPASEEALGRVASDRIALEMKELNPDIRVETAAPGSASDETLLILAGTERIVEAARRVNRNPGYRRVILARLDEPCLVAIIGSRSPCLACAGQSLLAPIGERGGFAGAVAMVATAETIKSLLKVGPQSPCLIEFAGWESRPRMLETSKLSLCAVCSSFPLPFPQPSPWSESVDK
jgi:adenylyltransferase/sulfurtransferase